MEAFGDARYVAMPCLLTACALQYMRFAKKPMGTPCHRVSPKWSERMVFVGLAAELVSLRLLPLCKAYAMNASCLTCLYYWKESKRASAIQPGEMLACAAVLTAWALPLADPADAEYKKPMEAAPLLDAVLSPNTCVYVVALLAVSVVVHCFCRGESAFGSCAPPALNFGVSAMLLKALVQLATLLAAAPLENASLWAGVVLLLILLVVVRSAAAVPLRRAMEIHDNLSVLAFYGVLSSAAAALTGCVVFGEMDGWGLDMQIVYGAVAVAHCWGMCRLGMCVSEPKGYAGIPWEAGADDEPEDEMVPPVLEMASFGGRGVSASTIGASTANRKSSTSPPPALSFCEGVQSAMVLDDDARIEDELFARALAPIGGVPDTEDIWAPAWPESDAVVEASQKAPQFDEDFEEIMRRFDDEDRTRTGNALPIAALEPLDARAGATKSPAQGLLGSAQTSLFEMPETDDEDEMLKGIVDLDEL